MKALSPCILLTPDPNEAQASWPPPGFANSPQQPRPPPSLAPQPSAGPLGFSCHQHPLLALGTQLPSTPPAGPVGLSCHQQQPILFAHFPQPLAPTETQTSESPERNRWRVLSEAT